MEKGLSLGEIGDNFLGYDPFSDFPFSGKKLYCELRQLQPMEEETYQSWLDALEKELPRCNEQIHHRRSLGSEGMEAVKQEEDDRLGFVAAKRACLKSGFPELLNSLEQTYNAHDTVAIRAYKTCKKEDAMETSFPLSDKSFCAKLLSAPGFDSFFVVAQKQIEALMSNHEDIGSAIAEMYLCGQQYDERALSCLADQFSKDSVLAKQLRTRDETEKAMQKCIIAHFEEIFPFYKFIKAEYSIPGVGRVDILARDNSGRDVVIELKAGNANPTRQLLDYATAFESPILIGITERELRGSQKRKNMQYFIYSDLCNKVH